VCHSITQHAKLVIILNGSTYISGSFWLRWMWNKIREAFYFVEPIKWNSCFCCFLVIRWCFLMNIFGSFRCITQWAKSAKNTLKECVFVNSAPKLHEWTRNFRVMLFYKTNHPSLESYQNYKTSQPSKRSGSAYKSHLKSCHSKSQVKYIMRRERVNFITGNLL